MFDGMSKTTFLVLVCDGPERASFLILGKALSYVASKEERTKYLISVLLKQASMYDLDYFLVGLRKFIYK